MQLQKMTSKDRPLYVNMIPKEVLPIAGTIGMTMAPGKKGLAQFSNCEWDRSLDEDLDTLKNNYKTDIIISLMEDFEFDLLKIPDFQPKCAEKSIINIRFDIVDGSVPTEKQISEYVRLAKNLKKEAENGKNIVIHCRGGIGRTGTLAACLLILFGSDPDVAIEIIRKYRKGAIETSVQEDFVKKFRKLVEEEEIKH